MVKRGKTVEQGKLAGRVGAREGKLAGQCGGLATTVGRKSEMRWVMGCRRVLSRDPVESSGFCTGKDEFYVLTSPLVQLISLAACCLVELTFLN